MLVRSAPANGGAITTEFGADSGVELGSLLVAAPRAGRDLPCRSAEADLWFAETPAELERAKALFEDRRFTTLGRQHVIEIAALSPPSAGL